jgi:hypothetical protein
MSGVVRWILDTKISTADMERALEAVNALPKDRTDFSARVLRLIELFGESGRNDVGARAAAINFRFQALARLSGRPEFKSWSLPNRDGSAKIATSVLAAAASEPLIEIDGQLSFDADRFFKRLLAMTEGEGRS